MIPKNTEPEFLELISFLYQFDSLNAGCKDPTVINSWKPETQQIGPNIVNNTVIQLHIIYYTGKQKISTQA